MPNRSFRSKLFMTESGQVLGACEWCHSPHVQPLAARRSATGDVFVEVRCPECFECECIECTPSEAAEFDRIVAANRRRLAHAYERTVRDNMRDEIASLKEAFDRDLIGPDDFR